MSKHGKERKDGPRKERETSRGEMLDLQDTRRRDREELKRKNEKSGRDKTHRPSTKSVNSDAEEDVRRPRNKKHRYREDETVNQRIESDKTTETENIQSKTVGLPVGLLNSQDETRDLREKRSTSVDSEERSDQRPREYKRYWGKGDPEPSRSKSRPGMKRNNDRYWNKYQSKEEDSSRAVGSRYYGEHSSKERKRDSSSSSRPVGNEECRDKKRGDGDDSRDREHDNRSKKEYLPGNGHADSESKVDQVSDSKSIRPQRKMVDMLTSRTGGAYIPPARLRMMQAQITDKTSAPYQRISWEALKKSIHGHINKVNTGNIGIIVRELLKENVVRGRGLLCRSIIQAQAASVTFTHVYAALVSVINSKFPRIGELLLKRLIIQFKRGFKRNDKSICISAATFVAHLVNQRVAHEILALEILTLLVESPTDDSVEVAIAFLKECGMKLLEVSNKGIHAIFEMLRNILHEGQLEKRVQYMIEVMFQVRKDNFRDHQAVIDDLDLVGEEDQFTHLLTLEDATDAEDLLNVFKLDPDFEENEGKYKTLKQEILDESSGDSENGSGSEDESDEESESEKQAKEETIIDNTETNLVALRRTIYLTIHSSLDFEECAHKLMRMELKPGQEIELCHMFLDCCAEQRTYEKFYGLLSQRFCQINKIFIPPFQQIFKDTYDTIHRLDTNKLRNVAKFYAHLLFTDAISWEVLSLIKLNEEETTSSSRIFIKILFQELSEYMGLTKLNERVKDVTLQAAFDGVFPRDNPKNTRFAINFFTSIGLGGLTDELREHLKTQSKVTTVQKNTEAPLIPTKDTSDSSSTDSSSSSSSSDSSSDSSSSSESDDSDTGKTKKSKKKRKLSKKKSVKKKDEAQRKKSRTDKNRDPVEQRKKSHKNNR